MKKNLLFVFALLSTFFVSAQYRCIPDLDANHNPGNSNYEDYPTYGSVLLGNSAIPRWSNVVSIPFPFYFNGQLVNSLKASSTGVITFDTTVTWAPPIGNAPLPSPMIPSKSICVWGLTAATQNSRLIVSNYINILSPLQSKQLWFTFLNYCDVNDPFSARTVTCSIVLEENSNNIYIVEQSGSLTPPLSLTFGIQIDQNTAVMAPGSPYTNWSIGRNPYSANNLYYTFLPEAELNVDGEITSASSYDYVDINDAPYTVGAIFHNLGTDTVRSLTLNYIVNGGAIQTENFSGLNILTGAEQKINFAILWTPADTGVYQFDYWADNINGNADLDTTNDHFNQRLYVAPILPKRRVLFEEFKGTWCLWSGYWTHKFDSIIDVNSAIASSVKYEQTNGLPWDYQDVNGRFGYYNRWAIPTIYGNGVLMQNDSLCRADYSVFPGCPWNAVQSDIDSLYNMPGLFYVQPQITLSGYTAHISGTVTTAANINHPCKMYVEIVEDSIFVSSPSGSSGETLFVNTTRKFLPDHSGISIGEPKTGRVDSLDFTFINTDITSNVARLKVVVFVQDEITKEIYQCGEAPAVQTCTPIVNITHYDICGGDSIQVNGVWRSETGNYPTILSSSSDCDSLQLDIVKSHTLWCYVEKYNGQVGVNGYSYYNTDTLTWAWYDSTALQIVPGATGQTFNPTHASIYCVIMTNQMGCTFMSSGVYSCSADSVNMTTLQFNLCQGDSVLVGGNYFYSDHPYNSIRLTNSHGCDSVIVINISSNYVDTYVTVTGNKVSVPTGSASYQWYNCNTGIPIAGAVSNTFLGDSINGGNYYCRVTTTAGCSSNSACTQIAACAGYLQAQQFVYCKGDSVFAMQQWHSSPGFYYDTLGNNLGCDTIMLTEIYQYNFNTNLSVLGNTITAQTGYVSYRWIDCQSGLTVVGQSTNVFTPTSTGNFAAILESAEGCIEQTPCVYVLLNSVNEKATTEISLWPNPANQSFEIKVPDNVKEFQLEIIDMSGRIVQHKSVKNDSRAQLFVEELPAGIYSVNIYNSSGYIGKKMLSVVH